VFWPDFVNNVELFFLVFTRVIALIMVAPMLSSDGVPNIAKIGLALFAAIGVFPWIKAMGYSLSSSGMGYVALLIGEGMIGISIGFFLQIVYAGFQTAGQFFALQIGFGASEVFDPLSQEELPITGQFFNFIAMYVFLSISGFTKMFLYGVYGSFQALNTINLARAEVKFLEYFIGGLGKLFEQALILSFPILGTLFVVSITMGLLAKAAPQLNLMNMGFPINIVLAFVILIILVPVLADAFSGIVDNSFSTLARMLLEIGGQVRSEAGVSQ